MKPFETKSLPTWRAAEFLAVDPHFDAKRISANLRPGNERESTP
jgi:hypothetical protein